MADVLLAALVGALAAAVVVLVEARRRPCRQIDAFAVGSLPYPEAEAFRGHLAGCQRCWEALKVFHELDALLERRARRKEGP